MKILNYLAILCLAVFAVSCNDSDDLQSSGLQKAKLTVSDDTKWFYLNFETGEQSNATAEGPVKYFHYKTGGLVETVDAIEGATGTVPAKWHIAANGFNIRTNNGLVIKTDKTDFCEVTELPGGEYTEDKKVKAEDKLIRVDMSRMQEGIMGYVDGAINELLSKNIKKTPTHSMPPYEYSVEDPNHVFVIKFADGSWAKVKFVECFYGGGKKSVTYAYEYMSK